MSASAGIDLLSTVLGFTTGLIVARATGTTGRGLYSTATVAGVVAAFVSGAGLFETMLAHPHQRFANARTTALMYSAAGSATMLVVGLLSAKYHALAVYSPFPLVWGQLQIRLAEARHAKDPAWLWARVSPLAIQAVCTTALFSTGRLTARTALLLLVAGYAATIVACDVAGGRRRRRSRRSAQLSARQLVTTGWRQHMVTIPRLLNYRADLLLLSVVAPAHDVGLYAVAGSAASLMPQVSWSLLMNLIVRYAKDPVGTERTGQRLILACYAISLPLALASVAFAPSLLKVLYGNAFRSAWVPFTILVAAQGLWLHSGIMESRLRARMRTNRAARAEILGFATLATITLCLARALGPVAPAVGSLAAYLVVVIALNVLQPVGRHRRRRTSRPLSIRRATLWGVAKSWT